MAEKENENKEKKPYVSPKMTVIKMDTGAPLLNGSDNPYWGGQWGNEETEQPDNWWKQ